MNRQIAHDFIKFVMENYGVRLSMAEEDADRFEQLYPDLAAQLEPEEIDENGIGRTLICIGFRPLPDDICAQLSKKYQLYK